MREEICTSVHQHRPTCFGVSHRRLIVIGALKLYLYAMNMTKNSCGIESQLFILYMLVHELVTTFNLWKKCQLFCSFLFFWNGIFVEFPWIRSNLFHDISIRFVFLILKESLTLLIMICVSYFFSFWFDLKKMLSDSFLILMYGFMAARFV